MKKILFSLTLLAGVSFSLEAQKVSIQGKSLTMTELLREAARQVNREVILDVKDPSPSKLYYDCEIEFESVVIATKGYFFEKFGIVLESYLENGTLVLKQNNIERNVQVPSKQKDEGLEKRTTVEKVKEDSKWKGFWGKIFSKSQKTKGQEKDDEVSSAQIKKIYYPRDEQGSIKPETVEKPDYDQTWTIPSKIKVEVLPSKGKVPNYLKNQSVETDSDIITLNVPPMTDLKNNSPRVEAPLNKEVSEEIKIESTAPKRVRPKAVERELIELDDLSIIDDKTTERVKNKPDLKPETIKNDKMEVAVKAKAQDSPIDPVKAELKNSSTKPESLVEAKLQKDNQELIKTNLKEIVEESKELPKVESSGNSELKVEKIEEDIKSETKEVKVEDLNFPDL